MLNRFLIFFLGVSLNISAFSQSEGEGKKVFENMHSLSEANELIKAHPGWDLELHRIPEFGYLSDTAITQLSVHQVYEFKNRDNQLSLGCVVQRDTVEFIRVKYIYLDGSTMTMDSLESLRQKIIHDLEAGVPFSELLHYTQDHSPTGQLDWFCKGIMVPEFYEATLPRKAGDIFTVDIPERNWYYVVVKEDANRFGLLTEWLVLTLPH